MDKQALLQHWINDSRSIVFFGGAGVSTESGIPDFRSTDGLYHQSYAYPPETILSHSFFERNPEEDVYKRQAPREGAPSDRSDPARFPQARV